MELPELKGYLRKKSRQDRWQRRYFEATTHYLTYYKSRESDKLLACIDLWRTQEIALNPQDPEKLEFSIIIADQSYLLKADTAQEAENWIRGLKARQHRPENAPSEAFSHRSERIDAESDVSSEYGSRPARPGYASSDTGSATRDGPKQSASFANRGQYTYTDSSANPMVPSASRVSDARDPDEDKVNAACCAECSVM